MFEIAIHDEDVTAALGRLARMRSNMAPVFQSIAQELLAETMENFERQGRPQWAGLKPATIKRRTKQGTWPGMILHESGAGGLKSSISTDSGSDFARVGSNKKYAAIHQFGGQAGRGHRIKIDPRPYLPADANGNLTPEAAEAVMGMMTHYLRSLVK